MTCRPIATALPRALTALLLLGAAAAVSLDGGPPARAHGTVAAQAVRAGDRFALCSGAHRVTCVVDGDTFWYRGEKIRIADINAPEIGHPQCAREAALGERATGRLLVLLNQGPFTLEPNNDGTGRDRDRYGRLLRTVDRRGASLGLELVGEGLAERWKGYRGSWC